MSKSKKGCTEKFSKKLGLRIPYDKKNNPVVSNSLQRKITREIQEAKRRGLSAIVNRGCQILRAAGKEIPTG